jgi:hypothetical protein
MPAVDRPAQKRHGGGCGRLSTLPPPSATASRQSATNARSRRARSAPGAALKLSTTASDRNSFRLQIPRSAKSARPRKRQAFEERARPRVTGSLLVTTTLDHRR